MPDNREMTTMKNFNVATQTVAADQFNFAGNQAEKAEALKAERILKIERDVRALPQYIKAAIAAAGYTATRIGGTTYKNSIWALHK